MRYLLAVTAVALALTACGADDGPDAATDGATDGAPTSATPTPPTDVPPAPGPVRTRVLATVLDAGSGAELCLGPVAESYPPQCSGPAIANWDWAEHRGMFEQQGEVRWGTFAVVGTWDGASFTLTSAVPGALHDPPSEEPAVLPDPDRDYSQQELEDIARDVGSSLPGAQGAYPDSEGHVLVDVVYDDGALQQYVDDRYDEGVVVVTGALVDA